MAQVASLAYLHDSYLFTWKLIYNVKLGFILFILAKSFYWETLIESLKYKPCLGYLLWPWFNFWGPFSVSIGIWVFPASFIKRECNGNCFTVFHHDMWTSLNSGSSKERSWCFHFLLSKCLHIMKWSSHCWVLIHVLTALIISW